MKNFRTIICITAILLSFAPVSYARTGAETLAEVEKLFMEAKYDRVVTEGGKLIDAGAHGREELCYLKGLSLIQLSRFAEARQTFEFMAERYPRTKRAFDGYIGIGDAYFLEGKYNEAVAAYNDALKNFPDHKNSAIVYYKLGSSYQKLGVNDKANEYFNKVKSSAPLSFESKTIPQDLPVAPKPAPSVTANITKVEPDASNYYYVQAGYFKTRANAEKLNGKLIQKGYESHVATLVKYNMEFYRVKVGRYKTRAEAEAMSKQLRKDGYLTKVCR